MNNFLIDYKTYMGTLAAQHRELLDRPEERHYFFGELPDFFANLRSNVHFPALIAEGSEVEYTGNKGNVSKRRTTSFSVVDSYDQPGDVAEMVLKVSNCEKIGEQILGRMIADPDSEKPFRTIDIESVTGEYNANEANKYVGYRITLTLVESGLCINVPSAWIEPEPEPEPTPDPEPEPEPTPEPDNQEENAED
jgi:hypothetical protein